MATDGTAAEALQATRSRLRAAVAPESSAKPASAAARVSSEGVSLVDTVTDGVEQWWHKSTIGRVVTVVGPLATPHLRPLARRHYRALLLSSAAAGALISQYPVRSVWTVLRMAGPVLLSGVLFEISKAGIRQLRGKPAPPIATSD